MSDAFPGAPRALLVLPPLAAAAFAQSAPRPADPAWLAALDQGSGLVQELALPAAPDAPFEVELVLGGSLHRLVVAPFSLRADDFQVRVQRADGATAPLADPPPPATVRGVVAGLPGSFFAGSLDARGLTGIARLAPGEAFHGVQPVAALDPGAPAGLHVVYDAAHALALPFTCGTPDGPEPRGAGGGAVGAGPDGGPASQWIRIACDADVQFFQANQSSVAETVADVETVLNAVDAIYDADFDLRFLLGTVLVRTAEPDPYTTSSPSPLLDEVRKEWLLNQTAIDRDVAHLFTGKNLVGSTIGIAYLGGVCSVGSGYGLSQSKFSSSLTSRVALTAHELGHNWGASHCNGTPQCWIMCSSLGGCSGGLTQFGPEASAEIEAKKALATCTTGPPPTAPPVLSAVEPASVAAVSAGLLTVTGSGLDWLESVSLGGVPLPSPAGWVAYGSSVLYVAAGDPPALGPVPIVATNAVGPSAPIDVLVTESFPPVLACGPFALTGEAFVLALGGEALDLWFLAVAVGDATTVPVLGWPLLAQGQLVAAGTLSAVGTAEVALEVPSSGVGLTFFAQAAAVDGATGVFVGSSAVQAAYVLL